jgi:multiple sugar transport system substrate-binding protein
MSQVSTTATNGLLRRSVLLRAAGGAAALLAACTPGQSGTSKSTTPVTLEIWHPWDATREPLFKQMAGAFQQKYPNITIVPTVVAADVRYAKYVTATASGSPPAIAAPERPELPDYVLHSLIEPLDALLKQEKVALTDLYDSDSRNTSFQGKAHMLPQYAASGRSILFYNKAHFTQANLDPAKPPATWDELEAYERKLTVIQDGALKRPAFAGDDFKRWLYASGGKWLTDDGRTAQFQLGPAVDDLDWMKRRSDAIYGGQAARSAFGSTRGAANVRGGFYTQELSMTISQPFVFYEVDQYTPGLSYGAGLAPVQKAGLPPAVATAGAGYGISKGVKTLREAFLLVKYISYDVEGQGWFMLQQKRPSPVKKHNERPEMRALSPALWDVALKALAADAWQPNSGVDGKVDALVNPVVSDALNGKQPARDGLQAAARSAQTEIDTFWANAPKSNK